MSFYLVLEKNHEHYQSDAHELVDNRAGEPHVEYFVSEHPHEDEGEHSVEERQRAALLHQPVHIVEQKRHYQDVDYVFNSEVNHGWSYM